MTAGPATGAIPVYHLITPGDHFSPRTGSAIPTVVNGLAAATPGGPYAHVVVVQDDTWQPRYPSAPVLEVPAAPGPSRVAQLLDLARGIVGLPRTAARAWFRPSVDRVRAEPAGVVVAHNAPCVPPMLAGSGHRVVLYAHNDILRWRTRRERADIVGACDLFVCVSEALADRVRAQLPARLHDRIAVVRNGSDPVAFRPAGGTRAPGPMRVLFIGRLIPAKGPDVLLDAVGRMTRRDVHVRIVGSHGFDPDAAPSRYERRLRRLAARLDGRADFVPSVARGDVPALLAASDVLVVPSRWLEPCGLTVGEGLAAGVAVVGARRGGIPEVLGDAGVLFDPDRPHELAAVLDSLAADPERRAERGAHARRRAEDHDWAWAWRTLESRLERIAP